MAPSNRQPPSQSVRGYANHLAAPQRPCPGGDVTRASFCLALQGLRQKQQRSWGKPAGEGPIVRKEYYYFPHHRLWNKHALSSPSLRVETQPWTARTSPFYRENKGGGCFFCSSTIFLSTSAALIHLHWPIVSENRVRYLSPPPPPLLFSSPDHSFFTFLSFAFYPIPQRLQSRKDAQLTLRRQQRPPGRCIGWPESPADRPGSTHPARLGQRREPSIWQQPGAPEKERQHDRMRPGSQLWACGGDCGQTGCVPVLLSYLIYCCLFDTITLCCWEVQGRPSTQTLQVWARPELFCVGGTECHCTL